MFDEQLKFVTSNVFPPWWLACIRLLLALYTLVVSVVILVWEAEEEGGTVDSYFSYFTNLSYIGICAYFFASGVQTFAYARNRRLNNNHQGADNKNNLDSDSEYCYYPLQRWPWISRYLHGLLFSTIVTFPILVTIVYWVLLSSSSTFASPYLAWSNISKHLLNSVMAIFEITLTNVGPLPWINMLATVLLLASYLGVAYITYATQGIYTYSFLNPKVQGKLLAAYIIGIAVGQCIIFLIVRGVIHLREWIIRRKKRG